MTAKIALIIIMVALLSFCQASAEIVKLQRYAIDTGSYVVPTNYEIQEPESIEGIYYEGLTWDIGRTKRTMVIIAECNVATDPRAIQYSLMANSLCNESQDLKNSSNYFQMEKPYPGWVTSCKGVGNSPQLLVYAGSVDDKTILVLSTTENPDDAIRILGNLRVIAPKDASDTLVANKNEGS